MTLAQKKLLSKSPALLRVNLIQWAISVHISFFLFFFFFFYLFVTFFFIELLKYFFEYDAQLLILMQGGDGRSMFATPLNLAKSLSITEDGSLKQNKLANIL